MDLKMAEEVDGIDMIVGGHSHTFLYSGTWSCLLETENAHMVKLSISLICLSFFFIQPKAKTTCTIKTDIKTDTTS